MTDRFSFVNSIVARFPGLSGIFQEHVTDNLGEILPHVFFGDLTRYVVALLNETRGGGAQRRQSELREILRYLEDAFSDGNDDVQALISVSFLENLPRHGEQGSQIREMVGPNLRRQLHEIG